MQVFGMAAIMMASLLAAATPLRAEAALPAMMPLPRSVVAEQGSLQVTGPIVAQWSGCEQLKREVALARLQSDLAKQSGMALAAGPAVSLKVSCRTQDANYLTPEAREAYRLNVTAQGIEIDADGPAGVLHAFATLRQLAGLGTGEIRLPLVAIDDGPRFAWRGVVLDVARHFMTVDTIKRQLDAMERVKLNVLHLHLSDNEAFRVESRRYPRLTSSTHGDYYLQSDMRSLVSYAAERGIRIVPEFDMPGHSQAMIEAYPEIGLWQTKPGPVAGFRDVALNPASDVTYKFLGRLLPEMASLFPDPYFHTGADEVGALAWDGNAEVERLMTREKLASRMEVEAYFHRRVHDVLRRAGKTMIGWQEVAAGNVPRDIVVQAWQTSNATVESVGKGHRTIVSAGYYLDQLMPAAFNYAFDPLDTDTAGFTPDEAERGRKLSPIMAAVLTDALVAKPLPPLTGDQEKLVLGAEAALWSELVTDEMVDFRLWPRAAALAERLWSPREVRDEDDMYHRLEAIEKQLTVSGLQGESNRTRMILRLSSDHADAVATLLEIVAPVRNMTHDHRILASLRGQKIVQPLNQLADAAPVDSFVAYRFAANARRLAAGGLELAPAMEAQLRKWRDNHLQFAEAARDNPALEPALPISSEVSDLAAVALEAVEAIREHRPLSAETADRARLLLERVEAEEAASARPLFGFLKKQPAADLIIQIGPGVRILVDAATNHEGNPK